LVVDGNKHSEEKIKNMKVQSITGREFFQHLTEGNILMKWVYMCMCICLLYASTLIISLNKTTHNNVSTNDIGHQKNTFKHRKGKRKKRKHSGRKVSKSISLRKLDDRSQEKTKYPALIELLLSPFLKSLSSTKIECSNDDKKVSKLYRFVAIDCEMVGVGRRGINSMLARCSIVTLEMDKKGEDFGRVKVLYDVYVKPTKTVTDYRTQWSGVTKEHLDNDNAVDFSVCRSNVRRLLNPVGDSEEVILVGHALINDFQVLKYFHSSSLIRDTARFRPFMRQVRKRMYPRKLSSLCEEHLGFSIQKNDCKIEVISSSFSEHETGHSSVEDAAAALLLYHKVSEEWEESLGFPLHKP
jgi:DNA polymerase III epsilon subunit-like protein